MFQLSIISLEKIEYRDKVDALICPGAEGEMTILENHIPLVTPLKEGMITIEKKGSNDKKMSISGGVLEVKKDEVVVLMTKS